MLPIRTLVVDDNPDFLYALIHWLNIQPLFLVVGATTSGCEALEQTEKLHPDLVLIDAAMPDMNGLDTTRQVKTIACKLRVIILALDDQADYRAAAHQAGADGFLDKAKLEQQLYPLVEQLFPQG